MRRFEQEARAAAALNHPNILAVYQMATEGNVSYMVTELLDGETLRERLRRGPVPIRKAIDNAVQIAHGLAAAHDKGITHRDLKPDNLFVTKDVGVIKQFNAVAQNSMAGPLLGGQSFNLDSYVVGKALDGLFYEIGQEEKQIRTDPAAQTTALLKEVFGKK